MTGARGPSILSYIRYHTDAEVTAAIRERHASAPMSIPDAELRQILAGVRELAGTNPAMATGGFTGQRGGRGAGAVAAGAARGRGAPPPAALAAGAASEPAPMHGVQGVQQTTIKMVDGRTRTGFLLAQSETSAVLLEGETKFVLLAKDGLAYREKAVTPKADWTHYDGSLTGNRYTPLELINPSNVQRVGAAWVFPIASNPRALQATPVVQDGKIGRASCRERV